jgi:hypothetical protein
MDDWFCLCHCDSWAGKQLVDRDYTLPYVRNYRKYCWILLLR